MKEWRHFLDGDCPECGDDVEALTSTGTDGLAYDGDKARCVGCGLTGTVCVDDDQEGPDGESGAHVIWSDDLPKPSQISPQTETKVQ